MFKRAIALAGAAACAGTLAVATPALANDSATKTVKYGSYTASTGSFSCENVVLNHSDGGIISLRVAANETRQDNRHVRSAAIATRLTAQIRTYDGSWKNVAKGPVMWGTLGASHKAGDYNVFPVKWGSSTNPRLSITLKNFDGVYRLKSVTRFYGDEGNRIAKLKNFEGKCRA
ncbi:MAG TPA: hypothetical protein VFJ12_10570 [Segeticoccus sp.]|nr:hypothetical protein [Segeticoccus sp.]